MKKKITDKIFGGKVVVKKGFKLVEVIIIMLTTCVIGMIIGASAIYLSLANYNQNECIDESKFDSNLKEIINTYNSIIENYYEDVDKEELSDSAIKAMLEALGDEYSTYMNTSETNSFQERMKGDYYGIGAEITTDTSGYAKILKVFAGSPAEEGGLKSLDLIKKVNGKDVKGMDISDVADKLKGPEETSVNVIIERDGKEIELKLTRRQIILTSISREIFTEGSKKIGYLKIDIFSNNTYTQFKDNLLMLEKANIDSLIIDVRDNSGGYLYRVSEIVSLFLPKDKVIYQLEDKDGVEKVYSYTDESRNYPIVVLINEYSASASEILTAALQESYGATIIGVNSLGKGTVQQTFDLESGGMIKYTIQKWLTPNGNWINKKGITPDIKVEQSEEYYKDFAFEYDTQLHKAIEYLKTK
jgi:carboxyl-terminal processing protease